MGDELHVYDFDGTLFRSPHAPAVWDGDWWSDPASLLPPCVPDKPGPAWWISPTVGSAKQSISNSDVFAIMMTGRRDASAFRYRVPELLKQKGLNFDAVHLAQGSGDSLMGKVKTIGKYLKRYPDIDTVRIWDDRGSHLRKFKSLLEREGYTVHIDHVRAKSADPLCSEMDFAKADAPKKKPSYVGVFLDARSKAALVSEYNLAHDKVKNEHVTLGFKLTPELEALIGQPVKMQVVGYAEDDLGQAVAVSLPGNVPFTKKGDPHVTLTHDRSVGAKYSNQLLAGGHDGKRGPTLTGIIDTFPRRLTRRTASAVRVAALRLTASSSITLARVGGLSPVKQRNNAAPERKGVWAFIWPNIEPYLLGSTNPEGLSGHESNVEVHDEMYDLQREMESIMQAQGWDMSSETWEDAAYTRNYGVEHRRLMRKHRELDSKIKNPSRAKQYARGIEKLRKFKYQGLLWTRLPTRNKTLRSANGWNLVDAGDLAKIARKTMAREMGDAYGRGLPANHGRGSSGMLWEVFVPARSGQIRSGTSAARVASRFLKERKE